MEAPDFAERSMRRALVLARRGYGTTSPNPMVGAVLTDAAGRVLGEGWHRQAGGPHAEIEALEAARQQGHDLRGSILHVTLEPCSTHGRTPPCTNALVAAGVGRVVVAATDPNPRHAGRGYAILRQAGVEVTHGVLACEAEELNEAFNHWIVDRTPFVTVKAAMTLDGKIATASGESKWITGERSRALGLRLRRGADAILIGVNTLLADDPGLTRRRQVTPSGRTSVAGRGKATPLRRVILDSRARTPLTARVVTDRWAASTTIVVTKAAPHRRVEALSRRVQIWEAPSAGEGGVELGWLLGKLGREDVVSLLVEGGGEVNASFLAGGWAQRVAFFYAPLVLGGRDSRRAVAGVGAASAEELLRLSAIRWRRLGPDLFLTARVAAKGDRD